jgi:ketosteroid isomerase-like protein
VSAENIEVVHRALAAISAGPEEILATAAELWDSDADYYPARKFPEAQACHGLQEIAQSLTRIRETWAKYEWVVQELIEVGDDRVFAWSNLQAQGRESGMNVEGDVYQCIWLRRGRLLRVEDHLTLKGALHAFGLEGDTLQAAGLRAPANLDFVRSICADWERGDFSSAEWAHPEIECVFADGPTPGTWIGKAAMAKGWGEFLRAWDDLRAEPEEYRELDSERVLVLVRNTGRGKASGVEVGEIQSKAANLFHVQDSKVIKIVLYWDRENALADLGLPSEGDSSRS